MVHDARTPAVVLEGLNEMSGPVFKLTTIPGYPRRGISASHDLDETTPAVDVLTGDMSLVGQASPSRRVSGTSVGIAAG